jgi:hypothetical protein
VTAETSAAAQMQRTSDDLTAVRADYPAFKIWQEGTVALCHPWAAPRHDPGCPVGQLVSARSSKAMRSRWRSGTSVAMS